MVIGFAAETESLVEYAQDKLIRKGLDLIVANDISASDSGFAVDTNRVTLIDSSGSLSACFRKFDGIFTAFQNSFSFPGWNEDRIMAFIDLPLFDLDKSRRI